MTFNPSGGVQRVQVPFRPPVALAEGMVVTFPVDGVPVYAEFLHERMERHHGAWLIFAYVRPIPTGQVLTGWRRDQRMRAMEARAESLVERAHGLPPDVLPLWTRGNPRDIAGRWPR
jgi:hypothetical protein